MKINSIIDLVKDLDTSRQTKNLNKLLIRILLHLQVEFSQNRFTGTAKFKFVFGAVDAYHSMTHYMFAPMYSVNDFGIAQFEVKKDKRYLATVKIKPFGTSSTGVKESDRVKATTQELEKGVYIMEITAEPGEYCIIFNSMGTGGYSGTFDFGID